jgi:hypothetical protein
MARRFIPKLLTEQELKEEKEYRERGGKEELTVGIKSRGTARPRQTCKKPAALPARLPPYRTGL